MDVYLMIGHGYESVTDDTITNNEIGAGGLGTSRTLKDGYMLVTFTECGSYTYRNKDLTFIDRFSDIETVELLQDPLKNKSELEKRLGLPMRIYKPGMEIPPIEVELLADWKTEDGHQLAKSGVYKAPITKSDFLFSKSLAEDHIVIQTEETIKPEEISLIYKDSLVPTEEEAQAWFKKMRYKVIPPYETPILSVMKHPGVYYWTGCRAVPHYQMPGYSYDFLPKVKHDNDITNVLKEQSKEVENIASNNTNIREKAVTAKKQIDKLVKTIESRRASSTLRQSRLLEGRGRRKKRSTKKRLRPVN